jgi:ELWxxDGT repeat protein
MTTRRRRYAPSLALHLLFALPVFGAGPLLPYLVKDLTPGESNASPRLDFWSTTLGEVVFFGVDEHEWGLWRTDGTASGTHRIYDGVPYWHVAVQPPAKGNGFLYYPVITDSGTWLYRTDGTTPGTYSVTKISAWYGGAPCGDGKFCFATAGSRVAVTDGTAAGTADLVSTASGEETDRPREMTALGKRVFFNAYDDQNGLCMQVPAGLASRLVCGELWTTDGTVAGTHLFVDLLPGGAPGAPEHFLASSAGKLYFAAADPSQPTTATAWVSDGTTEGTRMLSTKRSDWLASPYFGEIAGRVFFTTSDGDLFETDGTPEGTHSLRERFTSTDFILSAIDAVGGKILMGAGSYGHPELWSYDGTTLSKIADIPLSLRYLGHLQSTGLGYFVTDGGDVWSTDGTAAGTGHRFAIPAAGATMYSVAVTPTRLYYGEGYHRYVTDGTQGGTHQIDLNVRVANSTYVNKNKVVNGKLFFVGAGKFGASDGTEAGTVILNDGGSFEPFAHEGYTYFYDNGTLWKTDGTLAGTLRASDWLGAYYPRPPAFIGSQAVFAAGSPEARVLRRDPDGSLHELGVSGLAFGSFVSVAGGVTFVVDSPVRLMFTDGTPTGTRTVFSGFQSISEVVPLGAKAVFGAKKTDETMLRLWVTDFTAEGTQPMKDFPDAAVLGEIIPLFKWHNLSIFRVGPDVAPGGLWRSDGTPDGTFQLATGWPDAVLADGDELVLVRFTYPGYEIWTSDGTTAGTKKRDVYTEGFAVGEPFVMSGGGVGVIYRIGEQKELQVRNHRTKTVYVIDESGVRSLEHGVGVGNLVFFAGYRSSSGNELWAVPLDGSTPSSPSSVRIEYRGTAKTPTGVGAVFRVHVDVGSAKPPIVIATTVDGTLIAGSDYVPFAREIVFEDDHDATILVPLRHSDAQGTLSVVLSAPLNATITQGFATAQVGYGRQRSVRH